MMEYSLQNSAILLKHLSTYHLNTLIQLYTVLNSYWINENDMNLTKFKNCHVHIMSVQSLNLAAINAVYPDLVV